MYYAMAFVIGVLVNLAIFKVQLARMDSNEIRRQSIGLTRREVTIKWPRVAFDATFWGLVFLVGYFLFTLVRP